MGDNEREVVDTVSVRDGGVLVVAHACHMDDEVVASSTATCLVWSG